MQSSNAAVVTAAELLARIALAPAAATEPAAREPSPGTSAPDAPGAPEDDDVCQVCGGTLRPAAETSAVCGECGLVQERDSEMEWGASLARDLAHIRVVGAGSSALQPDLFRVGSRPDERAHVEELVAEYEARLRAYCDRHSSSVPFGRDVLAAAARVYREVQKCTVTRSQNRANIMAACLNEACIRSGCAMRPAMIAEMLDLPRRGISPGDKFLRSFVAGGRLQIDYGAVDSEWVWITSALNLYGLSGEEYDPVRHAAYAAAREIANSGLAPSSEKRSVAAAAVIEMISRWPSKGEPAGGFYENIRQTTVQKAREVFSKYHSRFEAIYKEYGLFSAPVPGAAGAKAKKKPPRLRR